MIYNNWIRLYSKLESHIVHKIESLILKSYSNSHYRKDYFRYRNKGMSHLSFMVLINIITQLMLGTMQLMLDIQQFLELNIIVLFITTIIGFMIKSTSLINNTMNGTSFRFNPNALSFDESIILDIYLLINNILPNKLDRVNEVLAFLNQQGRRENNYPEGVPGGQAIRFERGMTINFNVAKKREALENAFVPFNNFTEEVCRIFNRKEKSFVRFLNEIHKDYNEIPNGVKSISLWILCLPRNCSLDATKEFIRQNKFSPKDFELIELEYARIGKERFEKGWDGLFESYTEADLRRFFSTPSEGVDYIKSLRILKDYSSPMFFERTLQSFCTYVIQNESAIKKNITDLRQEERFPNFVQLENSELLGLKFELIKTTKDLYYWGKSLKHCIRNYAQKCYDGKSCLVGVYKDGKMYANIEIVGGQVIQIRGLMNSSIPEENEVTNYIHQMN